MTDVHPATAIRDYLNAHVRFLSPNEATVLALWVLHTHAIDAARTTPYMLVTSALPGCGKSTLLSLLAPMAANVVATSNTTTAAAFRSADGKTLIIDEGGSLIMDRGAGADLVAILNAGNYRGGLDNVLRCEGDRFTPKAHAVFGPKLIAGVDLHAKLPASTISRTIEIRLEPATRADDLTPVTEATIEAAADLHAAAASWALDHTELIDPVAEVPPLDSDLPRYTQICQPLYAIALLLGGSWPTDAIAGFNALEPEQTGRSLEDARRRLLIDLRDAFNACPEAPALTTEHLLQYLASIDDAPWASWYSRRRDPALDARGLSDLLRPFGIRPLSVRAPGARSTAKGYKADMVIPVCDRYAPRGTGEATRRS